MKFSASFVVVCHPEDIRHSEILQIRARVTEPELVSGRSWLEPEPERVSLRREQRRQGHGVHGNLQVIFLF